MQGRLSPVSLTGSNGVFSLNSAELSLKSVISANSGNLINHWSMSVAQFKVSVSHMCLAGAVVASLN